MPKGVYTRKPRAPRPPRLNSTYAQIEGRFWGKVDKSGECWEWLAGINRYGYGHFGMVRNGRKGMSRSNRVAWELIAGPIPAGLKVLHICDNRRCVRNEPPGTYIVNGREVEANGHLFLGTTEDNARDAKSKNRQAKGAAVSSAKLTDDAVLTIRARIAAGEPQRAIAREFGIHFGTVNKIILRQRWQHLP